MGAIENAEKGVNNMLRTRKSTETVRNFQQLMQLEILSSPI